MNSKEDILKIEIYDKDTVGQDDLEGIVYINMQELLHQDNVTDWIGLVDENGNETPGYLNISAHLVWSKKQYYLDSYNKTVKQIENVQNVINELERYIGMIEKPYGIVLYGEVINLTESRILSKGEEAAHYFNASRFYLATSKIAKNESLAEKLDSMFTGVFSKLFYIF